ncbi:MAG: long-chain fatty acid--CoA ligase [Alphaproteobacteria bacterium]|nr:long-chain fatty acid--CoA ligase [Alphaproteobacteria bacterium]
MLWQRVRTRGSRTILREKDRGVWKQVTWEQLGARARQVGMGLRALGFNAGDVACVLSETNPQWVYADLGILGVGGVSSGIYPTDAPGQVEYILRDSGARVLFVENEEQLDKALQVRERCPKLQRIVIFDMKGLRELNDPQCESFDAFLARGEEFDRAHPGAWEDGIKAVRGDQLAILVYTSGTTGPPKGAMLSHRNIIFQLVNLNPQLGLREGDERLAFLPMCHVAERMAGLYQSLYAGMISNYVESPDTVFENQREVQPTVALAVPRIWEKMQSGIALRAREATFLQRHAYAWAINAGLRLVDARLSGRGVPITRRLGFLLAQPIVRNIRRELGLNRARCAYVGAAPIAPDLIRWYLALGIDMLEVYGMTECGGVTTVMPRDAIRPGWVGKPAPHTRLAFSPEGEILLAGEHVFMGYWNQPEKTAETIRDGWLHTGDVGRADDGYVRVTDRMKDIIITAGGKNVTPSEIENELKFSPYIADAIVIGDRRKFLSCLVMIDHENVEKWAQDNSVPFSNFTSLTRAEKVVGLIQGEVERANQKFARVEQVKAFRLIEQKLEAEDPELTPTMKLKRAFVNKKYSDLIETMYADA